MLKKIIVGAALAGLVTAGLVLAGGAYAQQAAAPSGIKRTLLQKFDVPGAGYETVMGTAEIAANAMIGRHKHDGIETGYVLEGELSLMVAGQPDKTLKAGDSYMIPAGTPHDGKAGPNGGKVIATYIVEKGKPLATPAPQ